MTASHYKSNSSNLFFKNFYDQVTNFKSLDTMSSKFNSTCPNHVHMYIFRIFGEKIIDCYKLHVTDNWICFMCSINNFYVSCILSILFTLSGILLIFILTRIWIINEWKVKENTVLESSEWRACPNSWNKVSTSQWLSLTADGFLEPEKLQTRATICKIVRI